MEQSIKYSYDAVGNRIVKSENGMLTTYSYDSANQLLREENNGHSIAYSYDKNGNLIEENADGAITSYVWNEENCLAKVVAPEGSESYEYSERLRRSKRRDGEVTLFTWDSMNLLQETNTFSGAKAHYTDSPGTWGGLMSQRSAGSSQFFGFDMQGNTRLLAGENGGVNERHDYSAFGEQGSALPAGNTSFLFGGKVGYYTDARQRLYARARHYGPSQGRWMSKDPIGFNSGDYNLYRYVRNNPVDGVDPSGLWQKSFHRDATTKWASEVYLQTGKPNCCLMFKYPGSIGEGCASADDLQNAAFNVEDWHIHFNYQGESTSGRDWNRVIAGQGLGSIGGHDTRDNFYLQQLRSALRILYSAPSQESALNCKKAMTDFGLGLHSLEDKGAHMDLSPAEHREDRQHQGSRVDDVNYARGEYLGTYPLIPDLPFVKLWFDTHGGNQVQVRVWKWILDPTRKRMKQTRTRTRQALCEFLKMSAGSSCVVVAKKRPRDGFRC